MEKKNLEKNNQAYKNHIVIQRTTLCVYMYVYTQCIYIHTHIYIYIYKRERKMKKSREIYNGERKKQL